MWLEYHCLRCPKVYYTTEGYETHCHIHKESDKVTADPHYVDFLATLKAFGCTQWGLDGMLSALETYGVLVWTDVKVWSMVNHGLNTGFVQGEFLEKTQEMVYAVIWDTE